MQAQTIHVNISNAPAPPAADWWIGTCPDCGQNLIRNSYYTNSLTGWVVVEECWESLGLNPTCTYRKRL